MRKKIGAVVLNYKKYEDTLTCVNSLLNPSYSNTEIVIVDNGSGNESVKIFNSHFKLKAYCILAKTQRENARQ